MASNNEINNLTSKADTRITIDHITFERSLGEKN